MKKVACLIPTYSSDEFGMCQSLYELGGMVVMHDASGCNSTYTTHDEPRWYDNNSMIFISAISEMEAVMGDDDKLIEDICKSALELKPEFIAIVGAPIPYMIGTDFKAIARIIENRLNIPVMGFFTNGMRNYTTGIGMALFEVANRFAVENFPKNDRLTVNICGATPLDLSMNITMDEIKEFLRENDMESGVSFAMGSSLLDIKMASKANVSLVVSYGGLKCAKLLKERFNIPYVIGVPLGGKMNDLLARAIIKAYNTNENVVPYKDFSIEKQEENEKLRQVIIIGESVMSVSLATLMELNDNVKTKVLCPVDTCDEILRKNDIYTPWEDDIIDNIKGADEIVADPLYEPICPKGVKFIKRPHEAFSGRIFENVFLINEIEKYKKDR